jgi:hypothetical protein
MSTFRFLSVLLLVACSGGETTPEPKEPSAEAKPKPKKKTFSVDELSKAALTVALVPSPAEMQKSLSNAGLSSKLATMVPMDRDISMTVEDKNNLAIRTGVVLADLVLTVKSSTKEEKVARLNKLKDGLKVLGGGEDIQKTIKDLINQVNNEAFSNDDLLKEMDELSGVMVPELEYEAGEWVVPLIQAGSWLEGANLVSSAIIKESKFDAASQLLKQPRVVEYFLQYVEREGTKNAPDQVVAKLTTVLKSLQEIASKDKILEDDVKSIQKSTNEVLAML